MFTMFILACVYLGIMYLAASLLPTPSPNVTAFRVFLVSFMLVPAATLFVSGSTDPAVYWLMILNVAVYGAVHTLVAIEKPQKCHKEIFVLLVPTLLLVAALFAIDMAGIIHLSDRFEIFTSYYVVYSAAAWLVAYSVRPPKDQVLNWNL